MNRSRIFQISFLSVLALLLVLGACGDDNSDGSGSGTPEHDFAFVPYQAVGDPDGETEMMFSELFEDDRPVVLNFWAGQCPPCRAEMPHFQQLADEYEDDFTLIGIDVGAFTGLGSEQNALDLLEELDITYPAGRAVSGELLAEYNATGMPTTVFMHADGEIEHAQIGFIAEDEMRERLNDLF